MKTLLVPKYLRIRAMRALTLAAAPLALVLTLATPTPSVAQGADTSVVETIQKRGAIKVGLSTFVPWAMRDKEGELIGFEIDVATKLAKDMGVEVEFFPTAWDGIIPALLSGKFDVIISGMSVTAQRNLTVNFTVPYADSAFGIAANRRLAQELGLGSIEDYNDPRVTWAVRRGATPATLVEKKFPLAKILYFDEDGVSNQEVLNGNATASIGAEPQPSWDIANNPNVLFQPEGGRFNTSTEGFALRKGDYDALNFFNNWIEGQQRSGWLPERSAYWFRSRAWENQVAR